MLGKPKFQRGDKVEFIYDSSQPKIQGEIYIVDKYGTLEDDSDISYDILANAPEWLDTIHAGEVTLFKHIREDFVNKYE